MIKPIKNRKHNIATLYCPINNGRCSKNKHIKKIYSKRRIFIAIPYTKNYSAYENIIKETLIFKGLKPVLAKSETKSTLLLCKICALIQSSEYGLADISYPNPNVFYELAMLHLLGKNCALLKSICAKEPTDVTGKEHISYNNISSLKKGLITWINYNVGKYTEESSQIENTIQIIYGHILNNNFDKAIELEELFLEYSNIKDYLDNIKPIINLLYTKSLSTNPKISNYASDCLNEFLWIFPELIDIEKLVRIVLKNGPQEKIDTVGILLSLFDSSPKKILNILYKLYNNKDEDIREAISYGFSDLIKNKNYIAPNKIILSFFNNNPSPDILYNVVEYYAELALKNPNKMPVKELINIFNEAKNENKKRIACIFILMYILTKDTKYLSLIQQAIKCGYNKESDTIRYLFFLLKKGKIKKDNIPTDILRIIEEITA